MSSLQGSGGDGVASAGTVVITGATKGIGLALARLFVRRSHSVVVIARDQQRLDAVAEGLRALARHGCNVVPLALDVTHDDASVRIDEVLSQQGLALDILINNAGMGLGGPVVEQSPADLERLIALNITALTRLTHHAVKVMRPRGKGHIINIASLGGYVPGPNQAAYYASKSYVISLSEAVDWELSGSGVRVSVVVPGPVRTDFHADMKAETAFYRRFLSAMEPEAVARSIYRGYSFGQGVIVPGFSARFLSVALRILPHPLTVPLTGWLLRQRP